MMPDPDIPVGLCATSVNEVPAGYCAVVGAYVSNPGAGLPLIDQPMGGLPTGLPVNEGFVSAVEISIPTGHDWFEAVAASAKLGVAADVIMKVRMLGTAKLAIPSSF